MEENDKIVVKKIPVFLKVLCISSFIGSAIYLITYIIGYIFLKSLINETISINKDFGDISDVNSIMSNSEPLIKNGMLYYILSMIAVLICLAGVIMMLKLKKTGFYIYVVGEIAPVVLPFILLSGFGALSGFSIILAILPVLFIIMYALNLKHMS
jgi:hypothetical protein